MMMMSPLGFLGDTANEETSFTTCEPQRPTMIVIKSTSLHNDCVILNANDSLFDVRLDPTVGNIAPSLHP